MIRACVPSGGYGEKFLATLAQAGRHDRPGNSFFTRREDSLEVLMQDGLASLLRAYRTAGEAHRDHASSGDQLGALSRRPRPACALALTGRPRRPPGS